MTSATIATGRQQKVRGWYDRLNTRWCYVFLAPALVLTALFSFYPMIMSWVYSTMNWTGYTTHKEFIGLGNYIELVHDPMFWAAFARSGVFVLVGTPVRVFLALIIAIILNQQVLKLSTVFRTMFFMPVMASAAVIGVVMNFVLSPNNGPVNALLLKAHLVSQPIGFTSDPHLALWTVLGIQTWKNFGTTMIYWLAALQTVPDEYIEAAQLDGAGTWSLLRHIRLPILLPFALIITVLTAQDNIHAFGIVQALTGGGPYYRSQVLEVYIYQTAFQPESGGVPRLGYASAAGCFFGVATLLFALVQLWVVRRVADMRSALQVGEGDQR